jgi:hypothetical protein
MATRAHAPHTSHGLRTPNEAFLFLKSRTFGLGQTIWAEKFWGIWGIIITHLGTVSPLSMFFNIQPLFLKKNKLLYPYPKYFFGFRDLAIVCP